jgi:RNA-directed DNA polymerase
VAKLETLRAAYDLAKRNNGAPGIDGVTFEAIEAVGLEGFLAALRDELVTRTYRPLRNRRVAIPKDGGKVRVLGIPTIRDRVVQGALKLIVEPIFEADFHDGSYGYRPRRKAQDAVVRVQKAIVESKTQVIDLDLAAYFDSVRHDLLLGKVARRVQDAGILHLLKLVLTASGKRGVPQGGVISPLLLANIYLNEVDGMLERAREVTRDGGRWRMQYARYADDLVILVDGHPRQAWLLRAVNRRLREEFAKLDLRLNEAKSRVVDLTKGEAFGFLGFTIRRVQSRRGKWWPMAVPALKQRTVLLRRLREEFRRGDSQPVGRVIAKINPILRGWVNYFRIGNAARCFEFVKDWVERKVQRHLMRARNRRGFGWKRCKYSRCPVW